MNGFVYAVNIGDESMVKTMLADMVATNGRTPETFVTEHEGSHFGYFVIDKHSSDIQTAVSPDGLRSIVFSGRITNASRLRPNIKPKPKDQSDASLILALYKMKGRKCVHYLEGAFAFVLRDRDTLYAARDHLGIQPLYYSRNGEGWIFGSLLKAFLQSTGQVCEFPPGCYFENSVGARKYFKLPHSMVGTVNAQETTELVRQLVLDAVYKSLKSEKEVGVYLTGSVESCIIAAIAASRNKKIKTYSVGVDDTLDGQTAKKVAAWLGTDHTHITVSERDILENLSKIIHTVESYDAGIVRHAVADYFVVQEAAKNVSVLISGDAANELFGGYAYLRPMFAEKLSSELFSISSDLHRTQLQRWHRITSTFGVEGRVPFADRRLAHTVSRLPTSLKINEDGRSKWSLRRAFSTQLPAWVVDRPDSDDAMLVGIQEELKKYAESVFTDEDVKSHNQRTSEGLPPVRTKDELLYYQIWSAKFPAAFVSLVGRTEL